MTDQDSTFRRLIAVVERLRAPGGCQWDRAQTPQSLKPYLLEEAFEVLDAIEEGNAAHLCEELGDLLLHIVFQAQIAAEAHLFDIQDVIKGILGKMIRRHPHVFDRKHAGSTEQIATDWERRKRDARRLRNPDASLLDGIPRAMPALLFAARLTERASRSGFDWPSIEGVQDKLGEELEELREARRDGDKVRIRHEFGDVMFTLVNLARFLGVDPEDALRAANRRFATRFRQMEQELGAIGLRPEDVGLEELDRLWEKAKETARSGEPGVGATPPEHVREAQPAGPRSRDPRNPK